MQPRLQTPKTMEATVTRTVAGPGTYVVTIEQPAELERIDRERDVRLGDVAYCQECDTFLQGNQYWGLPKTVAMHRNGHGCRRVGFYRPYTWTQG